MTDPRADTIRQHIRELRGMADYAVRGQIVCSDVAMRSWADALESALDGLLADAAEHDLTIHLWAKRAEAAEARVKELEAEVAKTDSANDFIADRCVELARRVATLETALRDISTLAAGWRAEKARDNNDAISVILHNARAAVAASAPAEDTTAVLSGLPPDLARVLRDQSVIVPQDAAVFELIASWAKAPSNTASADDPPAPAEEQT